MLLVSSSIDSEGKRNGGTKLKDRRQDEEEGGGQLMDGVGVHEGIHLLYMQRFVETKGSFFYGVNELLDGEENEALKELLNAGWVGK